jgi:hypothetical protein
MEPAQSKRTCIEMRWRQRHVCHDASEYKTLLVASRHGIDDHSTCVIYRAHFTLHLGIPTGSDYLSETMPERVRSTTPSVSFHDSHVLVLVLVFIDRMRHCPMSLVRPCLSAMHRNQVARQHTNHCSWSPTSVYDVLAP